MSITINKYSIEQEVYVAPHLVSHRGKIVGVAIFNFKPPEYLISYKIGKNINQRWFIEKDITLAIS